MGERTSGGPHEGFMRLNAACARLYRAVTGLGPRAQNTTEWEAQLDSVALSLSMVTRIYATDALTGGLFPVSEVELVRGSFQGGAEQFVCDGKERYSGLHVALADLEDAIRVLAAARTQRPHDPPRERP